MHLSIRQKIMFGFAAVLGVLVLAVSVAAYSVPRIAAVELNDSDFRLTADSNLSRCRVPKVLDKWLDRGLSLCVWQHGTQVRASESLRELEKAEPAYRIKDNAFIYVNPAMLASLAGQSSSSVLTVEMDGFPAAVVPPAVRIAIVLCAVGVMGFVRRADTGKAKTSEVARVPELDSLRALAASAIVLAHFVSAGFASSTGILGPFIRRGWSGVDLFFVLSGYLITSIILVQVKRPGFLVTFYWRRCLRIWPIYYLTLGIFVMLADFPPKFLQMATYTQLVEWYTGTVSPLAPPAAYPFALWHTWTLAIEEQFYLLWPGLILLLGRRAVAPMAVIALLVSILLRAKGLSMYLLGTRCDGLALGSLLAVVLLPGAVGWRRPVLTRVIFTLTACLGLGYVVWRAWWRPASPDLDSAMISAFNFGWTGIVGWVVMTSGQKWLAPLRVRPLVGLGRISYGVYLYHWPILASSAVWASQHHKTIPPWGAACLVVVVILAAMASWRWVERPLLALKDRIRYDASFTKDPPEPLREAFQK